MAQHQVKRSPDPVELFLELIRQTRADLEKQWRALDVIIEEAERLLAEERKRNETSV